MQPQSTPPQSRPGLGNSLLSINGIEKSFPGVRALRGVDFEVRRGEVHALCGENGAGKSTLMHILSGVHQPERGSIWFNGHADIRIRNEHEAQALGIGMVFQERSLVGCLSIAENIFAGRQPANRFGVIDRAAMAAQAGEALARLGLELGPEALVENLSLAEQQMVEIAKALSLDARLLIFDEPTSALTASETAALFRTICQLKERDAGIIYISHRLEEVFRIADRVTVLKDGENRGTFEIGSVTPAALISLMVGRELASRPARRARESNAVHPALEVRGLIDCSRLRDVSFSVYPGEILAIAGLCGAGRTELALAVFGAAPRRGGEIRVEGVPVRIDSPADAMAAGIGYLPEDRRDAGLFLDMPVTANIVAARLEQFGRWRLNDGRMAAVAAQYRQALGISTPDLRTPIENLSGGNQQKVVLARWLLRSPKVLIVDEPTRGIDVGAKAEVHDLLRRLADQGTAVVLISSELPEILAIADRILVMREGRISAELLGRQATEHEILRYAATTPN